MSRQKLEEEMYADVCIWLKLLLSSRHPKSTVVTANTSGVALYRWLEQNQYHHYFPEYLGYDIRVDVTGIVLNKKNATLAFIECKVNPLSLTDVSQLLGYCRVSRPEFAFAISPRGISDHLSYLLNTYNRHDVLQYHDNRRIKIATWNADRKEIDASSVIPQGEHLPIANA